MGEGDSVVYEKETKRERERMSSILIGCWLLLLTVEALTLLLI